MNRTTNALERKERFVTRPAGAARAFEDALSLPVDDFIRYVLVSADFAAGSSDPVVWRSPCWELVRSLKAHPQLLTESADRALRKVELVACGVSDETPQEFWMRIAAIDAEDAMVDFLYSWEKVVWVRGVDPLEQAFQHAAQDPPPARAAHRPIRDYGRFINVAKWLQALMGEQAILLPCEKVGRLLGRSSRSITAYRRWAVEDGFLREVRRHAFTPDESRATEFLFIDEAR